MFGSCFIPPSAPLAPAPLKHHTLIPDPHVRFALTDTGGGTSDGPRMTALSREYSLHRKRSFKGSSGYSLPGDFYDNKIRLQWHSKRGCQTA